MTTVTKATTQSTQNLGSLNSSQISLNKNKNSEKSSPGLSPVK
jgi:hypothetical protein